MIEEQIMVLTIKLKLHLIILIVIKIIVMIIVTFKMILINLAGFIVCLIIVVVQSNFKKKKYCPIKYSYHQFVNEINEILKDYYSFI